MSEELKVCPFCGELNGAVVAGDMGKDGFFVGCTTPRCRTTKGRRLDTTAMYETVEQAVKAWNTRAAPSINEALRLALIEAREEIVRPIDGHDGGHLTMRVIEQIDAALAASSTERAGHNTKGETV